jgi:hypothetical protein
MTAPFVISTKWDTCLEWITNWHYLKLRGYFTLKSLLHSGLKQVMSLFTQVSFDSNICIGVFSQFQLHTRYCTKISLKLVKEWILMLLIKKPINLKTVYILISDVFFFIKKMSQNLCTTIMLFGPVTLIFYWPKQNFRHWQSALIQELHVVY